jgi:cytochrome c-type biogenesis protein
VAAEVSNVSFLAAFGAGVLSFISPCVLPLVPGYLSYISGISLDQMRGTPSVGVGGAIGVGPGGAATAAVVAPAAARGVFFSSLAFVLGFSTVFILLGAAASTLGAFLLERLTLMGQIAGVVLILFGLHTMGLLRIKWLYAEKRFQTESKPAGLAGAFVVGLAFAFGWTPCIGPILGAIMALAADSGTLQQGVLLLMVYSAGLGIPFLITSLAVNKFFAAFAKIRKHYRLIEVTAGVLMIAIGVLMFTNRFAVIARFLQPYLPYL